MQQRLKHLATLDESHGRGTQRDEARRCLFLAVLAHAVREARGIRVDNCTDTALDQRQLEAVRWLTEGDDGFKEVCTLAGLDWRASLENFHRRFKRK